MQKYTQIGVYLKMKMVIFMGQMKSLLIHIWNGAKLYIHILIIKIITIIIIQVVILTFFTFPFIRK